MPSSGRKVSRASVTEGARETESLYIFLHRSRSPVGCPLFKRGAVAAGD